MTIDFVCASTACVDRVALGAYGQMSVAKI